MIELKNVTKAYGNKTIFSKLSFRIDTGEFVVFSGKSGCGKSTMLSLIGGIEKATSGQIIVDGTDITNNYNRIKYFSEKVAFLFQNFALSENKTVKQNLEMVPKKSRSGVSIPDALKAVGIEDKLNEWDDKQKEIKDLREKYIEKDKVFREKNAIYEHMDKAFRDGQAGILAMNLEEGIPCPVCGATTHPNLASLKDEVPTKEELDKELLHLRI